MTDPRVVAAGSDVDQRIAEIERLRATFAGMLEVKPPARTPYARGCYLVSVIKDEALPTLDAVLATLRETRQQLAEADEFREEVERTSGALGHSAVAFPSISAHARAVREALEPFARMYRPGSDPREVACERGVASDLTLITSGDFERAAKVTGHE